MCLFGTPDFDGVMDTASAELDLSNFHENVEAMHSLFLRVADKKSASNEDKRKFLDLKNLVLRMFIAATNDEVDNIFHFEYYKMPALVPVLPSEFSSLLSELRLLSDRLLRVEVETQKCGKVQVYVQGDLNNVEKKAIFLTVHDIGSNHSTFQDFVEHPCMSEIKPRSVFIHVDVPGQEDNAEDLPTEFQFPTIQMLGEDLVCVLDQLKVKLVVGFGEGAGANILVRFALAHPSRVLGLALIHCVSTGVGVMEYFKDKFMNWKLSNIGMNPSTEQYLVLHKFGAQLDSVENKETLIQDYTEKLKNKINAKNLRRFVEAYMNRKDITASMESNLKAMDVMLVSGGRAAHLQAVQNLYGRMDKQKTSFLKLDSVGDVFAQAPEKLAQSLLLFVKGLGYLTSVTMPGVERQRTFSGGDPKSLGAIGRRRTLSMEEYDTPRPRRLSLTIPQK